MAIGIPTDIHPRTGKVLETVLTVSAEAIGSGGIKFQADCME